MAKDGMSLKDTAKSFVTTLVTGDTTTARASIFSYEEMLAMITKPLEKDSYERELIEFVDGRRVKTPVEVKEIDVVDVLFLPAAESKKRKRDMTVAAVRPVFSDAQLTAKWPDPARTPIFFVLTDKGWKVSLKK